MIAPASTRPSTRAHQTLRICHLGKFYPPARGGIETHVQTLAQAQAALGAQVRVVCVNHADENGSDVSWRPFATTPRKDELDGKVRVVRLGSRISLARWHYSRGLRRALADMWKQPVDILHLHVPNPTMVLALATMRFPTPLVISYHSDVIRQKRLALVIRPFERAVFAQASCILVASPDYAAGSPYLAQYAERTRLLPYGLNLGPYLEPSAEARHFAQYLRGRYGGPLWLSVGRLVYYKGLDVAIAALQQVPGQLLIVGAGPEEEALRNLALRMGVGQRVVWLGTLGCQQLIGAYLAATAMWFPSNARSEAFGLVQVEAMASGCPVINAAIEHSGVPWVCPHGLAGLTVPVNNPSALANAAWRLLCRPELRRRLASAGRSRAQQLFDDRRMAQRSLELYREMLKPRPDRSPWHVPVITSSNDGSRPAA